ncbi:hypothetical protein ACLOJK_003395 [Asimina triloba]
MRDKSLLTKTIPRNLQILSILTATVSYQLQPCQDSRYALSISIDTSSSQLLFALLKFHTLCLLQSIQAAGLMASLTKQAPVRRLVELLQEQQEPFLLDIYLREKGYSRKIPTSAATHNSWIRDSCRKLLRSSSSGSKNSSAGNSTSKASVDTKLHCSCPEDCKQSSPVSVLESPSDEGSPAYSHREVCRRTTNAANPSALDLNLANSVIEDSTLSASLWDLLGPGSSQKVKSKRVLQQIRLLLFDCVREVIDNHARKESWHLNACVGSEKLGKMVFDEILSWGKQSVGKSNITQMIDCDFSESRQLRKHFQPQIKEIGMEIGDIIFKELRDEIVEDMVGLLFSGRS